MNIPKNIQEIIQLRDEVASLRRQNLKLASEWVAISEAFLAEHQTLIDARKATDVKLAEKEATLRAAMLTRFEETGDKAPCAGLGIRVTEKLVYDPIEALAWAKVHAMCLALDTRAFEKVAKASPMDFVKVEQVPIATIAMDLNAIQRQTEV